MQLPSFRQVIATSITFVRLLPSVVCGFLLPPRRRPPPQRLDIVPLSAAPCGVHSASKQGNLAPLRPLGPRVRVNVCGARRHTFSRVGSASTVRMMAGDVLSLYSPAKTNLFLRITKKRDDGFHELASVFQAPASPGAAAPAPPKLGPPIPAHGTCPAGARPRRHARHLQAPRRGDFRRADV